MIFSSSTLSTLGLVLCAATTVLARGGNANVGADVAVSGQNHVSSSANGVGAKAPKSKTTKAKTTKAKTTKTKTTKTKTTKTKTVKPTTTTITRTTATSTPTTPPSPPGSFLMTLDEFKCAFTKLTTDQMVQDRWTGLQAAVAGTSLGSSRSELAMFLGEIDHESDGLTAVVEYCALPSAKSSCVTSYDGPAWCNAPVPAGKHYYGRGFIQLSWSCNYQAAGKSIGVDLLSNPDLVATDITLAWKTAVWFWYENNCGKGSFADATRAINGQLECNGGSGAANQVLRIQRYQEVLKCMSMTDSRPMSC
ncbi:lysozyme-like domain-containing protein [Polychytrium aggregatum]|uniref:lysozyme-like domain-containing protein n=1 Tax=Polychytrium aggregatum TaxID=110093 RepID=UPI0022FF0A2A|nr:lysozyme-like domain-containing protein [Polychytrium aggregatum]KAI9209502.1 lysozyme-like domain-containing protein [Polychytrium aggregatum]